MSSRYGGRGLRLLNWDVTLSQNQCPHTVVELKRALHLVVFHRPSIAAWIIRGFWPTTGALCMGLANHQGP